MEERYNDTCYLDISEFINTDYKPSISLTSEGEIKLMESLYIGEEQDTIITGSYYEWCQLVGFIIEKYNQFNNQKPQNKSLKDILDKYKNQRTRENSDLGNIDTIE